MTPATRPPALRTSARALLLLALATGAAVPAARAEVIDVTWTADGTFERETIVASRRVVEACVALPAGARVAWRFDAAAPLDFNVHYHVGRDVHTPVRHDATAGADGTLQVDVAQTYCWMWTNRGQEARALRVSLRR